MGYEGKLQIETALRPAATFADFRRLLEKYAAQMGINGGVLFTGPLYGDAKWAAYRDADLFVMPSQNENFGNTAAELSLRRSGTEEPLSAMAPRIARRVNSSVSASCQMINSGNRRCFNG